MVIHQKFIVRLYLMLWLFGIIWAYLVTSWRTYPLKEVSKPDCKKYTRAEMNDDCKMKLPIIDINNLSEYAKDDNNKYIYSDLRWWTYSNWRDIENWSSPWIDIATSEWTPVYSIWDGEVIISKKRWEFGNTITIKHKYGNDYIYSSYSHLSERLVETWTKVSEWELIWKVGRTWYVRWQFGNHLDFEITTKSNKTNYYPYSFNDCKEWEYHSIIESGKCRNKIFEYTADPIVFLNSNGAVFYSLTPPSDKDTSEEKAIHQLANQVSKTNTTLNNTNSKLNTVIAKIKTMTLASSNTKKKTTINTETAIKKTVDLKLAINDIKKNDIAKIWSIYKFGIKTDKKQMKNLKIVDSKWILKIGKNTNKENTKADVYIKPIKKWSTTIQIMDGKKIIASYNLKIT